MVEGKSLYDMGYEQGLKDTLDKYDEICRIASEIRIAVGCKTAKECWELARNGDIQVVKHGRWVCKTKEMEDCTVYWHECSECGCRPPRQFTRDWETNFCPHCGARMDGTEND